MTSMNSHSGRGCDGVTGRFPYFSSHKKLQLTPSHTVTLVPSSGGPSVKRGAPQRRKCSPVSQSLPVAGARASSEGPPRNEPTVPTRPAPLPYGRGQAVPSSKKLSQRGTDLPVVLPWTSPVVTSLAPPKAAGVFPGDDRPAPSRRSGGCNPNKGEPTGMTSGITTPHKPPVLARGVRSPGTADDRARHNEEMTTTTKILATLAAGWRP